MQLFAVNFSLLQDHSACFGRCPQPSSVEEQPFLAVINGTKNFETDIYDILCQEQTHKKELNY